MAADDLLTLMGAMQAVCLLRAPGVPEPGDETIERLDDSTDAFCRRFAETLEAEPPTSDVAFALLPRLHVARLMCRETEARFESEAAAQGQEFPVQRFLEYLLVDSWHGHEKARWHAGEF